MVDTAGGLIDTRVEIHDRNQLELKLNYQPSSVDRPSQYYVEVTLFLPRSLNIDLETWSRDQVYADLHNYVRLKTPVLPFAEILRGPTSPLRKLETRLERGEQGRPGEFVYEAKMLGCVMRGALRLFARGMRRELGQLGAPPPDEPPDDVVTRVREAIAATHEVLERYRTVCAAFPQRHPQDPHAEASLRLVDEWMSLLVEQFFRRVVVEMEALPRRGVWVELRRELMDAILRDEAWRKGRGLPSVLQPDGDNEEYVHRLGLLKKFCMNILFLKVQRTSTRKRWEEILFAVAAGGSMAFALGVGLFAQSRYPQASFNFFLLAVVGYMFKDRLKDGLRRWFSAYAGRLLYERTTRIADPATQEVLGVCHEKVDYDGALRVPPEVLALREGDDLTLAARSELDENIIRYRKKIVLESERLPRVGEGLVTGVTDIIRVNISRLLRDMDDPEYAQDYVDLDDFSVGKVHMTKSYRVDVAFRFRVDDGHTSRTLVRLVQLVLDRNGIKRLVERTGPA